MRTALLSALAAVSLTTAAQAGDLAAPAPHAVNYVKVCDAYGAGFFYIPGTETCLKIGGYVRAEYRVFDFDRDFADVYDGKGWSRREYDGVTFRTRTRLTFDARTNTEYGLLRSYVEWWFTYDTRGSTRPELWQGYIQFGGLTAGRTQSFFDFYLGNHYSSYFETAHSDSQVNLLAYTFSFGNGVTASVSLEDSTTGNVPRRFAAVDPYGGQRYPDLVGRVKVDQAWGSAQIMGALHHIIPADSDFDKDLGWAVGAGITVNLPWIADGDNVNLQAAYTRGAISYVTPDPFIAADFIGDRQATAWSVAAGFTHVFNPKWSLSATVSYLDINHPRGDDLDLQQWDAGVLLEYAPVDGLTIGFSVEYKHVDTDFAGVDTADGLVGLMRIQRNF